MSVHPFEDVAEPERTRWKAAFSGASLAMGLITNLETRVKDASFSAERECSFVRNGNPLNSSFAPGTSMLSLT